ncbi:MAG: DUF2220 family protein [Pirellulaceae bacterium]|nr:DUF2220 family protein [Pirellulaceae bacterium]
MLSPQEIVEKAQRVYPRAISAWLANDETFFPYRMPCDLSMPASQSELIRQVDLLRNESKEVKGSGYSITWEEKAKRLYGRNHYPVAISIESLEDLVKLVRKLTEFRSLQTCVEQVRHQFPKLNDWTTRNWQKLLLVAEHLNELLTVTQFMIEHPRPDCFTRELPLSISSKLIERHKSLLSAWFDALLPVQAIDYGSTRSFEQRYGFRYARQHLLIRFLDLHLAAEVGCPWTELSLPVADLDRLSIQSARVFVVENKVNLLTLPKTMRGIALGGVGHGITMLFDISWLPHQELYYWGDLDTDGFEILASLRHRFPNTQSLFMDLETLQRHRELAITITNRRPENATEPPELTESERAAYRICKAEHLRIEQEHIAQSAVNQWFDQLKCCSDRASVCTDSGLTSQAESK